MILYQNSASFDIAKYQNLLTKTEKLRISKFVKQNDVKLGISGLLLIRILTKTRHEITRTAKPFIKGLSGDFNISHHKNYAIGIFSKKSIVGIDVTIIDPDIILSLHAFKNTFTDNEWAYIHGDIPTRFSTMWALKEAYLKSTGEGISIDLRRVDFSISKPFGNSKLYLKEESSVSLKVDGISITDYYFEVWMLDAEHLVAVAVKDLDIQEFNLPLYKYARELTTKDLAAINTLPFDLSLQNS
jgi:phosphopantetheinyl transferase